MKLVATMLATCALVAFAPHVDAGAGNKGILRWQGRQYAPDALPEMPVPARAAVEAWAEFALANEYHMELDDEARLLFISRGTDSVTKRRVELIEETIELFDRMLPPPPPTTVEASANRKKRSKAIEDEIPEDPEGPPPGWKPPTVVEQTIEEYRWGATDIAPDTDTMVLLALRNERDYHATLDALAGMQDYLKRWVKEAKDDLGFVLELPLAAAYVLNASGQEEWNPENELVNRVARLCLLRRFGQQPHWLVQGWAWYAEFAITDAVYCFPNRSEFVSVAEHADWNRDVEQRLKRLGKRPLKLEVVAQWKRGTYEAGASRYAWATVDWTLRRHPGKLALLLDDLRRFREKSSRRDTSDTSWERVRDYEIPVGAQTAIFQARLSNDFLSDMKRDLANAD